jgi:hypothetical protein
MGMTILEFAIVLWLFGCLAALSNICICAQWIDIYLGIAAGRFRCFVLSAVDVNRLAFPELDS